MRNQHTMMLLSSSCKTLLLRTGQRGVTSTSSHQCLFGVAGVRSMSTFSQQQPQNNHHHHQSSILRPVQNFTPSSSSTTSMIDLNEQVQSLNEALALLSIQDGPSEGEQRNETLEMDSVKRKRHKKIKRHKYRKRLKETRAERKRLGKR